MTDGMKWPEPPEILRSPPGSRKNLSFNLTERKKKVHRCFGKQRCTRAAMCALIRNVNFALDLRGHRLLCWSAKKLVWRKKLFIENRYFFKQIFLAFPISPLLKIIQKRTNITLVLVVDILSSVYAHKLFHNSNLIQIVYVAPVHNRSHLKALQKKRHFNSIMHTF